ncbi:PL29 family lyase N-terminal domain-containing protein [Porphyromonas macacae]|nr:PL29 family lyase N-terminal domain-containing protein [Porphyromonas macacae]
MILLLPALLLTGCTNLDDVNRRLDEHEGRLNALEKLTKTANDDIKQLKGLVDALNQKKSITSYSELPDGSGYELVMSDGSKITLKNGRDGEKPIVGVKKDADGILYWTINGEFMLDANGKKIKAEGQDGVTPKMRVDAEGYWETSLDGGKTWQRVLDKDGNPVRAKGTDATVDLNITETEDAIIITYKGQTFTIYKGEVKVTAVEVNPVQKTLAKGQTFVIKATVKPSVAPQDVTWSSSDDKIATVDKTGKVTAVTVGVVDITAKAGDKTAVCKVTVVEKLAKPNLSIEYVAEQNLQGAVDKLTFAASPFDYGWYYVWSDATTMKMPAGYHLPSQQEWRGVVPSAGAVFFGKEKKEALNLIESIKVGADFNTYAADYLNPGAKNAGEGITYAIRFKKTDKTEEGAPAAQTNEMLSAWRYEYAVIPDGKPNAGNRVFKITVRYLGEAGSATTLEQIAKEDWWKNNATEDIVRYFPCAGFGEKTAETGSTLVGTFGIQWSSTSINETNARSMRANKDSAVSTGNSPKRLAFVVRPFADQL